MSKKIAHRVESVAMLISLVGLVLLVLFSWQ